MHLLLTDRLTCPRCGPTFGLILRSDRLADRRVVDGGLGCANCRHVYPIRGGVADLRGGEGGEDGGGAPERPAASPQPTGGPDEEALWGERLHALLGIAAGTGQVALVGPAAGHAPHLAARLRQVGLEVEVATVTDAPTPAAPGVSRILTSGRLPFYDRVLRGAVMQGPDERAGSRGEGLLAEALRCLGPGGRLVVLAPWQGVANALGAAGLDVLLDTPEAVVGGR